MAVDVFNRCGCRDPESKKPLEKACSRLGERGHWTWYFECTVSTMVGRRERARRDGFPTKATAIEARDVLLSRSREESTTVLWSVGKWLRFWLSTRTSIRPSTLRSYTEHVDSVLIPHLGSVRLGELIGRQISAILATLAATPKKVGPGATVHIAPHPGHAAVGAERGDPGGVDPGQRGPAHRAAGSTPSAGTGMDRAPRPRVAAHRPALPGGGVDGAVAGRLPAVRGR